MNTDAENKTDAKSKMIALFGGADLAVIHEDGTGETVRVRQLRLLEYEKAFQFIQDEFALTAFCTSPSTTPSVPCGKDWVMKLHPESYETLLEKVEAVNKEGFFDYASRRQERQDAENLRYMKQAAELPPAVLAEAIQRGQSILQTSLRAPRPRPV